MQGTTVNLTVIGDWACSTTRIYLAYLASVGVRPKNLWLIRFGQISKWHKLLRRLFGTRFVDRWIWRHSNAEGNSTDPLHATLQLEAGLPLVNIDWAWQPNGLADGVDYFHAEDFNDPVLQARMQLATDTAFLYTNGGIVPAALLNQPSIRVLHIHPGIVPHMRGSDCLLWSALVRGRIGVSCFYMGAGIDDGAVICQQEFEIPRLPSLLPLLNPKNEDRAYRALLYAVDPHFRASLLARLIAQNPLADLRDLPTQNQSVPERPAYLWMHPKLRLKTIREVFA